MFKRIFPFLFSAVVLSVPVIAQTNSNSAQWLAPACMPKLYGLQDPQGEVVLKAQYDFLFDQGNNAWIAISDGHFGVINQKGDWLIKPVYEGIRQYANGKAIAAKKVKRKEDYNSYKYSYAYGRNDSVIRYGMIDESNVWLIDAAYEFLQIGDDGTVLYTDEYEKYGFLNPDGTILIKAQYDYATVMSGGAAIIGEATKNSYENRYDYMYNKNSFKSGNYYLIDRNGSKLNKEPYDLIREFSEGRAACNKGGLWKRGRYSSEQKMMGGKWGFVDASGNEVVAPQYDYVYDYENGKAKVKLGERTFWIDKDGKETTPPVAAVNPFEVFCLPGSFGYVDLKGNWVIEPQFYAAHEFSEGLAAAMTLRASDQDCDAPEVENEYLYDDDMGLGLRRINLFGIGARRRYDETDAASEYKRPLRRLYGYIDSKGMMVIEAKYEVALPFHNNRAYVSFRGKWGIIDRSGNWIMQPVLEAPQAAGYMHGYYTNEFEQPDNPYIDYANSDDNYVSVTKRKISRSTDESSNSELYYFSEGMGAIRYSNKYGFVDTTGKIIIAPVYDYVTPFSQGLAAVRHGDLWGYVDKTGKEVIPLKFGTAEPFASNGTAVVSTTAMRSQVPSEEVDMVYEESSQQYFGYIDRNGNWVIKPQFTSASNFVEGLAVAAVDYKGRGYIDKTGKFVINPKYDYAGDFSNGYAYVRVRMYSGVYIDKTGKVSKVYTSDNPPADKAHPLRLKENTNGRYGFVNEKGELVIPYNFRYAGEFVKVN